MAKDEIKGIVLCVILVTLVIAVTILFLVLSAINSKRNRIIKENSEMLKQMTALNLEYERKFKIIRNQYTYTRNCNSKAQYDRCNLEQFLITIVDENDYFITQRIADAENNAKYLKEYLKKRSEIKSTITEHQANTLKIPYKVFVKKESDFFEDALLHPITNFVVHAQVCYTSPAGRNSYSRYETFDIPEVKEAIKTVQKRWEYMETKEYERSLMTPSLRYSILKRDGFRCQVCGASQKDGATLHVDHIIPVSKGGKTIPSNLQTLCDTCNLGKSDKY